jgi:hypothetical protein
MLKCFREGERYKSLFAKLKIGKSPAMDRCGTNPDVYLDLKEVGSVIDSYLGTVRAMKGSLLNAFSRQFSYSGKD